jgi:hypothetical protein
MRKGQAMNDDRDTSWSELQTLRDQLREAIAAKQHANADARLVRPAQPATRRSGGRVTPGREIKDGDGAANLTSVITLAP